MYVFKSLPIKPRPKQKMNWNKSEVRIIGHTLCLEIGTYEMPKRKKRKRHKRKPGTISTAGVKKELLEYHYGIYRMFPCGKQFQYHMQYLHVPGVTERSIR